MTTTHPIVQCISECFIRPQYAPEESKQPFYLPPWELLKLNNYIHQGLIFAKPPQAKEDGNDFMKALLKRLKHTLSFILVQFYPLAGRLKTVKIENPDSYVVYVDCNDSPGAKFIYATLDMTISDILSPTDVPLIVKSFFDINRAVNHDYVVHTMSLLSIQVTELVDGVFIGCSMNHSLGDGTSYWNFLNMWSEIFRAQGKSISISRPPILKRWFPEGHGPIVSLPRTHHDEFISRSEAPQLRWRVFHFSAESIAKLKAKANSACNTNKISSFQSLSALVWRSITRARNLRPDQITSCVLAASFRTRLDPPISENYFGNLVSSIKELTMAGELLEHDLGWAAWKLHEAVVNHNDKAVRRLIDSLVRSPRVFQTAQPSDLISSVVLGNSPRFNVYETEFGMGKAVALRSAYENMFDGNVSSFPGFEGGGSIDLEICLSPASMCALESDKEFMEATCNPIR